MTAYLTHSSMVDGATLHSLQASTVHFWLQVGFLHPGLHPNVQTRVDGSQKDTPYRQFEQILSHDANPETTFFTLNPAFT